MPFQLAINGVQRLRGAVQSSTEFRRRGLVTVQFGEEIRELRLAKRFQRGPVAGAHLAQEIGVDALFVMNFLRNRQHRFAGFDGNNESTYLGIARFLIHEMDRFNGFKKHDLDSHAPSTGRYRRMLEAFLPLPPGLGHEGLTVDQLIKILNQEQASTTQPGS